MELTPNDRTRYDRQLILNGVGERGQLALKQAKVLIVGMGGLGCPVAQYLVGAGVGTIGLMDQDIVDITNLHRQILYSNEDLGKNKSEVAAEKLGKLNTEVSLTSYPFALTPENAEELFRSYDIIVDGTDNFQSKYLINDAAILTDKPVVGASIYKFQGQLAVFNYQGGPSYRCLYPNHHLVDNNNCEETGVLGVLPGMLGTMQANEVLKTILGIGTVLSGKLQLIDALTMHVSSIQFSRNEKEIQKVKSRPLTLETIACSLPADKHYLDVREPHEQPQPTGDHILRIPMSVLQHRASEIPKDTPIYVYCQSGIRSKKAIDLLQSQFGYSNLIDAGGIEDLIV